MNKRECIAAVEEQFQDKRTRASVEQGRHIEEVYEKIPRIREIDRSLRQNSASFFRFIAEKSDDDAAFQSFRQKSLSLQDEKAKLLTANGYPIDYTDKHFDCEICQDEGYVGVEMCNCYRRALSEMYMKQSRLSTVFRNQTLDRFRTDCYGDGAEKMQDVLQFCKRYTETFDHAKNVMFLGVPGCGKTYLSVAIGYELIRRGKLVLYAPVQDMVSDFEAEKFGKRAGLPTEDYLDADLLIIDDLGTEFQTAFAETVLYQVINTRINRRKPMIISTNYTLSDFSSVYHDRLVSRLNYDFVGIPFPPKDMRQILRNQR